jgi:hypothetical protein
MSVELSPFAGYWWLHLIFSGLVLWLLKIDLDYFHKKARAISIHEALGLSGICEGMDGSV